MNGLGIKRGEFQLFLPLPSYHMVPSTYRAIQYKGLNHVSIMPVDFPASRTMRKIKFLFKIYLVVICYSSRKQTKHLIFCYSRHMTSLLHTQRITLHYLSLQYSYLPSELPRECLFLLPLKNIPIPQKYASNILYKMVGTSLVPVLFSLSLSFIICTSDLIT